MVCQIMPVIALATLVDYGIITKVDTSQFIRPQKVGVERRRCKEARREAEFGNLKKLSSSYFDGKKSMTRVLVKNNKNTYMVDGPHNTFVSLQWLKHLNNTEMNIVKEVVQRNAFFARLDQLLLVMCTDKDVIKSESYGLTAYRALKIKNWLILKRMMRCPTLMKNF